MTEILFFVAGVMSGLLVLAFVIVDPIGEGSRIWRGRK